MLAYPTDKCTNFCSLLVHLCYITKNKKPENPLLKMEPNIRLQPQDTYLLVSKLDQLIRVCSKISNMIMAMFIINIGIILLYFIGLVLVGIGAAAGVK